MRAVTVAPRTNGVPTCTDPSAEVSSTSENEISLPTSWASDSIRRSSPGDTRYCFPPVRITAYDIFLYLRERLCSVNSGIRLRWWPSNTCRTILNARRWSCSLTAQALKQSYLFSDRGERSPWRVVALSRQLLQQRSGFFEIPCVKSFGKPAIDVCEQLPGCSFFALLLPQPRQAHHRPQLKSLRLL